MPCVLKFRLPIAKSINSWLNEYTYHGLAVCVRVRAVKLIEWNISTATTTNDDTEDGKTNRGAAFNRINTTDICLDRSNASTSVSPLPIFFFILSSHTQWERRVRRIFLQNSHFPSFMRTHTHRQSRISIKSDVGVIHWVDKISIWRHQCEKGTFVVAMLFGIAGFYGLFMLCVVLDHSRASWNYWPSLSDFLLLSFSFCLLLTSLPKRNFRPKQTRPNFASEATMNSLRIGQLNTW